jgi:hypothetical protein
VRAGGSTAMLVTMDPREHDAAENQLRVYEVLEAALGRRNEICELVASSADPEQAHAPSAKRSPRGPKNSGSYCVLEGLADVGTYGDPR